jgi:hypothetical protein
MKCPHCQKSFVSQGGWEYHVAQAVCVERAKNGGKGRQGKKPTSSPRPPKTKSSSNGRKNKNKMGSKVCYDQVWNALGFKAGKRSRSARRSPKTCQVVIKDDPSETSSPSLPPAPPKPQLPPDLHIPLLTPNIKTLRLAMYTGETENECYLCMDGGDLVCCDYCSKVVHMSCWEEVGGFSQRDLDGVLNDDLLLCDTCCVGIADNMVMRKLGGEVISKDGYTVKQWREDIKKWTKDSIAYDAYVAKKQKKAKGEEKDGEEEGSGGGAKKGKGKGKGKKDKHKEEDKVEEKEEEERKKTVSRKKRKPTNREIDSDSDAWDDDAPATKKKMKTTTQSAAKSGTPKSGSISTTSVIRRMSHTQRERVISEVCLGFYDPVLTTDLHLPICPTGGPGGLMCCKKCSDNYAELLEESDKGLKDQRERVEFVKNWLAKEEELLRKLGAEKINGEEDEEEKDGGEGNGGPANI